MAYPHEAKRENHKLGHVAKAVVPYVPNWPLPQEARDKNPWMCCLHDEPGGGKYFIAFGGKQGMEKTVDFYLGPILKNGSA